MKTPCGSGFHLEETATIAMFALLDALIVFFTSPVELLGLFLLNLCCIASVIAVRIVDMRAKRKGVAVFRDWLPLALLIILYMEHSALIPQINPHDVDDLLIGADRFLFAGSDPTVLMERFTRPLLTETLQIVYASFYFFPALFCLRLYRKEDRFKFHVSASAILIGFYISYVGYYLAPAVGPRFTLDRIQSVPLEGLLTFHFLRNGLDQLGGIARDCYPSGHALISVLTLLLAGRYHRPFVKIAFLWTFLLLISILYLRYHYFVDVLAGVALAVAVFRLVPAIERQIRKIGNVEGQLAAGEDGPLPFPGRKR